MRNILSMPLRRQVFSQSFYSRSFLVIFFVIATEPPVSIARKNWAMNIFQPVMLIVATGKKRSQSFDVVLLIIADYGIQIVFYTYKPI